MHPIDNGVALIMSQSKGVRNWVTLCSFNRKNYDNKRSSRQKSRF